MAEEAITLGRYLRNISPLISVNSVRYYNVNTNFIVAYEHTTSCHHDTTAKNA